MSPVNKTLRSIEQKEKEILKEEGIIQKETTDILHVASFIENAQRKEIIEEKKLEKELTGVQKFAINQAKEHKFIFQVIILCGIILVWRGLWGLFDQTPIISSFIVSVIIGFILLWIFNKLTSA
jgi:hypothetical protein